MPPNPYQSPEERGTVEDRRPRNPWKAVFISGISAASAAFSIGLILGTTSLLRDLGYKIPDIGVLFGFGLTLYLLACALVLIGGIGWLVTNLRRR